MRSATYLILFLVLLSCLAQASTFSVLYPPGSSVPPAAPLVVYEITLTLDESGDASYTTPNKLWGNLSQIDYRASGLADANTLTLTLNTSQVQLDSYNVTSGNTSRWGAVGLIADKIDFAITSGTANATITTDLFITR